MSLYGALAGGLVGTLVLTTGLRLATELGLTRIDLPFLLGTAFTSDRRRAGAIGYALHFVAGLFFAAIYWVLFDALGESSWSLGALFGLLHAAVAATALVGILLPLVHPRMGTPLTAADDSPQLEPPGFLLLNYGPSTPMVMAGLHILFGAIVGEFIAVSS